MFILLHTSISALSTWAALNAENTCSLIYQFSVFILNAEAKGYPCSDRLQLLQVFWFPVE